MRKYSVFRRVLRQIPALLAWMMVCLIGWGFVFLQINDTTQEHKLVVYFDCQLKDATKLMLRLEKESGVGSKNKNGLSGDIRKIKARPFDYNQMGFSGEGIEDDGDIFIVAESDMEAYAVCFSSLPEEFRLDSHVYELNGVPVGIKLCDAEVGAYYAADFLYYDLQQSYYLCYGTNSSHAGKTDTAAYELAKIMLGMNDENNDTE